jgi:hypothetical protein
MPVDRGRQDVTDLPVRGVPTLPGAAGGMSRPLGPPAPIPSQPGAQNPAATAPLPPDASPAPVDRQEMPQAPGPHVEKVR